MSTAPLACDVAIIGAGPVGCVTALAFARKGAEVLLLEAHPRAAKRLAGEWLHPPAVAVLERLGLGPLPAALGAQASHGFVIFPEDRSAPMVLRYPAGALGLSCEHNTLVCALRTAAAAHPAIHYLPDAKVHGIEGQRLHFTHGPQGAAATVSAVQIVGASGRTPLVRQWLGLSPQHTRISRMAGVLLADVTLPLEGFGHVLLGAPGPVLLYRLDACHVRLCLDVPASYETSRMGGDFLWETYSPVLPVSLRPAFRHALHTQPVAWAANAARPRAHYGREGFALVGDAVGYFHPVTAAGMTLGFLDGDCLAQSQSFAAYQAERSVRTYVPGLLATSLYDVFTHDHAGAATVRQALYRLWRHEPQADPHTMRLLSGEDTARRHFLWFFLKVMALAGGRMGEETLTVRRWQHTATVLRYLGAWGRWLIASARQHPVHLAPRTAMRPVPPQGHGTGWGMYGSG